VSPVGPGASQDFPHGLPRVVEYEVPEGELLVLVGRDAPVEQVDVEALADEVLDEADADT